MKTRILTLALVLFSFAFITTAYADSHAEKTAGVKADKIIKPSGFLGNYDDFKVMNPQTNAKVWLKKNRIKIFRF